MSYLKTISRFRGAGNLGGIVSVQVARKEDFVSIPDPVDGIIYGNVVFKEGRGWVKWDVTIESAGTDSSGKITREGFAKGNRQKFLVPRDRSDIRAMFERAADDELIVLYRDANNRLSIFGLLYAPVRFRYSHSSGSTHGDKNGYECEFYYDGPDNVFEYQGSVATAPPGPAPAIVRFNGQIIEVLSPGEELNIISDFGFETFYTTAP